MFLLAGAGIAAWFPLNAGTVDFWNKKPPADWTNEEIDRLISKSPWAKPAKAQYAPGEGNYDDKPRGLAAVGPDLATAAVTLAADIREAAAVIRAAAEVTPVEDGPAAGSAFRGSAASAFLAWGASAEMAEAELRPRMRARFGGRALVRFWRP